MESDLIPYSSCLSIPARAVLVLAPHPDDEVFGCGGAIASHVHQGQQVHVVILTDGALYGDAALRQIESQAAAAVLGYGMPEFWAFPDRELAYSEALAQRLVNKIISTGCDLVYSPSPWEVHPDHRHTSTAAIQAVRLAGVRIAFYEVGSPLRPNLLLNISASAAIKQRAMQCFASQQLQQDYASHITALNFYRTYTLPPEVTAAEAYLVLSAVDLTDTLSGLLAAQPVSLGAAPSASALGEKLPLVSVMIRSMDREYLQQALDSVALQTYPNIEVVVLAAHPSHQNLQSRCGPFELRLIPTASPLPRSPAANHAMDQARGEYLLFLDDDDWLLPGHVARLAQVLRHQPTSLAAYTGVTLISTGGQPQGQVMDLPYDAIRLLAGNVMPIHSVLFSCKLLALGCRFDESLDLHEDWDFWLQVARHTVFAHVPGVSAVYRMHGSSGVHSDNAKITTSIQTIFDKWQTRWDSRDAIQIMQRVRSHDDLEQQLASKSDAFERADAALEQQRLTARQSALSIDQLLKQADQHRAEAEQQRGQSEQVRAMIAEQERERLQQELIRIEQLRVETEQLRAHAEQQRFLSEQQLVHSEQLRQRAEQELVQTEKRRVEAEDKLTVELRRADSNARDIANLIASSSWKMTAPLRWLSAKIKQRH